MQLPFLKDQFLLRPEICFLNHGSFGACPRVVFEEHQRWQRELEEQPVEFLIRRIGGLLAGARARLAEYVGAQPEGLILVPNATHGINIVARSLDLRPGDEVLTTDHEYGASDRTWRFVCAQRGARYINQPIRPPLDTPEQMVEQLWAGVTPQTRVIFLSHITSPTALIFPVAQICARARAEGILTVIDGAHAPSQIDLDMAALDADFYTGNCHKWLCNQRASGFLYARPEARSLLAPLIVSWGWEPEEEYQDGFQYMFEWTGTYNPSPYLTIPTAINFQAANDWPSVRAACHELLRDASREVLALTGQAPLSTEEGGLWAQMRALPLPPCDHAALKARLLEERGVEAYIRPWNGTPLLRISIQCYNGPADIDRLLDGLRAFL